MLTNLEKKVLSCIQGDIAIVERPYLGFADQLGITEDTFIDILRDLHNRGVIRRFGATLRHQRSGFQANAMVAWKVPGDQVDQVGETMASHRRVSHCYHRNAVADWPYNLYTMVHAESEERCRDIAKELSELSGITEYSILFSREELKKTSMTYFHDDDDSIY